MSLASQTIPNNVHVSGTLSCASFVAPDASIVAADIITGANIEASKTVHRENLVYQQDPSGAVAAATVDIYYYRASTAGTVNSLDCMINGTLATGDGTVTVDLKKSTSAGAFASILTGVVTLDSGNTLRTSETGTISSTGLVAGDILQLVIAQGKTTGNQAKGLCVNVQVEQAGL